MYRHARVQAVCKDCRNAFEYVRNGGASKRVRERCDACDKTVRNAARREAKRREARGRKD